jgi:hypothetical protein
MAIIFDQPYRSKGARSVDVQLLFNRAGVYLGLFLPIFAFILVGILTDMGAPASVNDFTPFNLALHFAMCDGNTPGFCPNPPSLNM